MLPLLAELYHANEKEIAAFFWSQIAALAVISIARLPDPRKFSGAWGWFYGVFFEYASRLSATRWDEKGGHLKLPGFQVPRLKDVPDPRAVAANDAWREAQKYERPAESYPPVVESATPAEPRGPFAASHVAERADERVTGRYDEAKTVNFVPDQGPR